ncbi:Na(+)/H(+)-K(+) antiporter GerN [Acaryochloris thomasi RCC1774]|uniref:Na(+)/H(+)-K(+) antiporter GerN n=1 Tax=Acaryochloris thomasi RCC1774 TaxID=1764569 RepID=A0A2W1JKM7_9CYAN|nr:cation:proton antiporter [Acaryochloris thomasi]PZD72015.1 Na(+)/H(+)-K(+) antiporter GerN [Acaryochloris thomasi RCC1774]
MYLLLVESAAQTLREPIATFVLLLAIVLVTPPIFERLKLPGLVGLLVAGVIFGSLGWLKSDSETMKLLSEMGKIYLMFVAGLEIDLEQFQRTRNRSLSFGLLTFAIPMVGGIAVGLLFNFGWLAAVLIGSLLASHTLLAYPIIQRLGVMADEAVTITVGATIFTDIGALLVLAICLGVNQGDFTLLKLVIMLGSLTAYTLAVLVGLRRFGHFFFRKTGQDEGNQFLFVLLAVFLCAVVAQLIGVENIIGAFLAGLAINSVIGDGPVKEKTEFLGSVLFIPMFFINMGLLLDLEAFGGIFASIQLPLVVVGALLLTKMLASLGTKLLFGYSWPQFWMMWSLSIPQVAATLAAALVGYEANIIDIQMFNSVILLMLVTSILGPLVTTRFARQLAAQTSLTQDLSFDWLPLPSHASESFTVVVPVYNPRTEQSLIELAALMASYEKGRVVPLAIALAQSNMDAPQLERSMLHCRRRLQAAEAISQSFDVPLVPRLRLDHHVAQAISYVGWEEEAKVIVLGMGQSSRLGARLLGSVQDDVMRMAHCLVVVARLLTSPVQFKTILLPIENPSPDMLRVLRLAQVLAVANHCQVTMLHVCSPRASEIHRTRIQKQLETLAARLPTAGGELQIQVIVEDASMAVIARVAEDYDLVMLRSQRQFSNGFRMGTSTRTLLEQLSGSVILVNEPYPQRRG